MALAEVRQLFDVLLCLVPSSPTSSPSMTVANAAFRVRASPPSAAPRPSQPTHIGTEAPPQSTAQTPSPGPQLDLPADALEQVLLHCDDATLLGVAPLVCRAWRTAATAPRLWRHRLSPSLMAQLEPLAVLGRPLEPHRLFLILQGRNFLRNPTFRKDANATPQLGRAAAVARSKWQRAAWVTTTALGEGLAWELPPAGIRPYGRTDLDGAPPLPLPYPGSGAPRLAAAARVTSGLQSLFGNGSGGFGSGGPATASGGIGGGGGGASEWEQGCLAAGKDWCEVVQVVELDWELQRRGLSAAQAAALLDAGLGLRLRVHVGSRWDCVGQYSVGLMLDEGNGNANGYGYGTDGGSGGCDDSIPSLQSFVKRPTRHHFYTGHVCCTSDVWQRFEYTVPSCPRGFRRAVVLLRGRRAPNSLLASSPLPRFPGAKFAAAELVFV